MSRPVSASPGRAEGGPQVLQRSLPRFVGAQHEIDVRMGDEASRPVEDQGIAGAPHLDLRDHVPDELQVDLGHRHADG